MIKKIGRPKKIFISIRKAKEGLKKGQKIYKVIGGYKRTSVTYKISKTGIKKNTKIYVSQNKEFIKKLAKL